MELSVLSTDVCSIYHLLAALRAPQDFLPDEAVFHARVVTTGITETMFRTDRHVVSVFDPGGARSERRKWHHVFDGATTIVFTVALSGYANLIPGEKDVRSLCVFLAMSNVYLESDLGVPLDLQQSSGVG